MCIIELTRKSLVHHITECQEQLGHITESSYKKYSSHIEIQMNKIQSIILQEKNGHLVFINSITIQYTMYFLYLWQQRSKMEKCFQSQYSKYCTVYCIINFLQQISCEGFLMVTSKSASHRPYQFTKMNIIC